MKKTTRFLGTMMISTALLAGGCAKKNTVWSSVKDPQTTAQVKSFVAEKAAQAGAAAKADGRTLPPEFKAFFAAAAQGDWPAVKRLFDEFSRHAPQYAHSGQDDLRLQGTAWCAVMETFGLFEFLANGNEKYAVTYVRDIIDSIPPGSIYFGGTDPGRFLITGLEKSQVHGDPFFVLTQNALADGSYLKYLRSMYGKKLHVPTDEESQKCFQDYTDEAEKRAQKHQLKPGENVNAASGRVQISGMTAVMEINGLIAKVIFDKNPGHEIYLQESYPLDWMNPYLEPHGLIFKLNRQPLPELSAETVQQNQDYWTRHLQPMIGDWLDADTPVETVAAFADKVFRQHDLSGFTGDRQFVQNEESCKMFAELRSSMARLYVWRMEQAATAEEKQRMARAADFAFRQTLALCPYATGLIKPYVDFLKQQDRAADAALVENMTRPWVGYQP